MKPNKPLKEGDKLIVSNSANHLHCQDLTVLDLKVFNVEKLMQTDPKMPTFFVYYCTTSGDILGKLMFTNREVIFEPLNENLKGFYNYKCECVTSIIVDFC